MGSPCVKCSSRNTYSYSKEDEPSFRKKCVDCGHEGGPYCSPYEHPEYFPDYDPRPEKDVNQSSLTDF